MSTNKPTKRPSRTNKPDPAAEEVSRRFGARLRETRGRKTLRDLSMESGVSIAYISDLERGILKNPSLSTLSKIARALGVSVDYLLGAPQEEPGRPVAAIPPTLAEFLKSAMFKNALADMAKAWDVDASRLSDEWISVMASIDIAGRRPKTASDWMFVFETIRRALDS